MTRLPKVALSLIVVATGLTACGSPGYGSESGTDNSTSSGSNSSETNSSNEGATSSNASPAAPAASASWQDACLLTVSEVASLLAPYGVAIDHTDNSEANLDDPPSCSYDGPSGTAGAFNIERLPYDASTTDENYGFLTAGGSSGWRAPDAVSGYNNACQAAQDNDGATCIPNIGQGLIVANNSNEAVLFLGDGYFYDYIVEIFAGGDVPHTAYQTLGQEMADASH